MKSILQTTAEMITKKSVAWLVLLLAFLMVGLLMGFGGTNDSGRSAPDPLPSDSQAAQVASMQQGFPGGDVLPAVAIVEREGGIEPADSQWIAQTAQSWADLTGNETVGPIPSEDGEALTVIVSVDAKVTGLDLTDLVKELRSVAQEDKPEGLTVELTGGAAFAADISSAFEGADVRLLMVTALVVAVLLVLTYRSPILWLVPLLVIGVADRSAAVLTQIVADWSGKVVDGSTSGITSVLVFGAGTNYALLLVSRYREELRRSADDRQALAAALKGSAPAVVASNVTVVVALLVLLLSVSPNSQSLGVSAAVGLLVAVLFALFVLPAALSLFGRKLFWPFVPKYGDHEKSRSGVWFRVAGAVVRRPVAALIVSALTLGVLASGLFGLQVGLSQTEQFRVEAESVEGLGTLAKHFSAGAADPVLVVVPSANAEEALGRVHELDGVESASPTGENGDLTRISATLLDPPGTPESVESVEQMRTELAELDGLVGGGVAKDLDIRKSAERDLKVVIPLILSIVFFALIVIFRSLVTPVVLILINLLSTLAALGLGSWVSFHVFGFPALDANTPIYVFLFLVALSIDYTVFLVLRAREESAEKDSVEAMVQAVGLTGGVITSAGLVLASVFAVLGLLPLITLTQVGLIVGLGILLDTFLVRTVVVPAVFAVAGEKIWWPRKKSQKELPTH